jgi:hypothetical protein
MAKRGPGRPFPALDPEVVEKIRQMTLDGRSLREIAWATGVTDRTVSRYRTKLGIVVPRPVREFTDDELRLIRSLLDDECPWREVARTVGVYYKGLQARFAPEYPNHPKRMCNPVAGMWKVARELGLELT